MLCASVPGISVGTTLFCRKAKAEGMSRAKDFVLYFVSLIC